MKVFVTPEVEGALKIADPALDEATLQWILGEFREGRISRGMVTGPAPYCAKWRSSSDPHGEVVIWHGPTDGALFFDLEAIRRRCKEYVADSA